MVVPKDKEVIAGEENAHRRLLRPVYDHGKVPAWEDFDTVRQRVDDEWNRLPPTADVLGPALKEKIARVTADQKKRTAEMLANV